MQIEYGSLFQFQSLFQWYNCLSYTCVFSSMTTVLTKCWDIPGIKSVSSHETMTYFTRDINPCWWLVYQTLKICEKTRKWGEKWYLKTKAEDKSKAEVSFGEYWPRNHLPRVAISSCPFGICFKYNFVFWLLWIKYMTCVLILLWRLFIELEIRSKRII